MRRNDVRKYQKNKQNNDVEQNWYKSGWLLLKIIIPHVTGDKLRPSSFS